MNEQTANNHSNTKKKLAGAIPRLFERLDDMGKAILLSAKPLNLPANTAVFQQGDVCQGYILLIRGSVKVFTRTANGREILLYRVQSGESCTLTTSCLLADNHYPAEGITEADSEALMISSAAFNKGLQQSAAFRQFVFDSYGQRIRDVISLVEAISFGKIEARLAREMLENASGQSQIKMTHQQLATDLGTAREVVSRHLKEFEGRGWVKLSRGSIKLLNISQLEAIAD